MLGIGQGDYYLSDIFSKESNMQALKDWFSNECLFVRDYDSILVYAPVLTSTVESLTNFGELSDIKIFELGMNVDSLCQGGIYYSFIDFINRAIDYGVITIE